jgi:hypothetical protein
VSLGGSRCTVAEPGEGSNASCQHWMVKDEISENIWLLLTYGGRANGIPKNWETEPEAVPVKAPLSRVTVGCATARPIKCIARMSKAGRFIVKPSLLHLSQHSAP